ncbi:MAG: hypothetical protein KatS3mg085_688 [Candidatus Dojkabacteria bacterium]|nr:MAG: hypothetical protein KatS3mg085_688 [Candidatus Dojkabacteria bacterium]
MGKKKVKSKSKNNRVKTCTLFVDGMHCASCEVLLEKKLLKQEGIQAVDASLKGRKVEIRYVGNYQPNIQKLNEEFSELGYKFNTKKIKRNDLPLFSVKNGELIINHSKLKNFFKIVFFFISFLIIFFGIENLSLGRYINVDSNSSIAAFFVFGIVASLSSCAALVGGVLLSMIKQWNELYIDSESNFEKASPHILFHSGRLISFGLFGGFLGLLGESISLSNNYFYALITILVSIIMFILALQMIGVEWAQRFRFGTPKAFSKLIADESSFKGKYMPFFIGASTFFLPCGFTLIAQTLALTSGSILQGSLIMISFALGTLPVLMGISYSGVVFNRRPDLTAKFNVVAGLIVIFFAIYNINGQLNVLGLPSLSDIEFFSSEISSNLDAVGINSEGIQQISIIAKGFEYIPTSSMTLKAGIPAKFFVDNQGVQGCGAAITATGLFDGFVWLKNGENVIDLGIPKEGKYKLTCSMGMVKPIIINVI